MVGSVKYKNLDDDDDYYRDLTDDEEYEQELEVDEDYRDLTDEAKSEIYMLADLNYREPHGFYRFREFRAQHPSKHPNYFQKDETHLTDDALFLQQLVDARVPWNKQHSFPKHAKDALIKDAVLSILCRHVKLNNTWDRLREQSIAANDAVYSTSIKAAAYLVYMIFNEDTLLRIGLKRTLDNQLKELYEEIKVMGREDIPVHEVCEEFVRITADNKKYSLVTEGDVAKFLFFDPPREDKVEECNKIQILDVVNEVVEEMRSTSPIFQADDYARMLVRLLTGPSYVEVMELMEEATRMVNRYTRDVSESQTSVEEIDLLDNILVFSVLGDFICQEQNRAKWLLREVVQPLFIFNITGPCYVSSEILEIVEVAELRRRALGSRFIGRSHLIWAFYECGYGLPKFRKILNLDSPDKDHPPYHIYVAAMKLTVCNGENKMRLEHFIFAVLFVQDTVFDGSNELFIEMQQDFIEFMEDIVLERTKVERKSQRM